MKAIEFTSKAEDGKIKIPKKYLELLNKEFRIIILVDENNKNIKPKANKKLTAIKIKTKDLAFNRDEANKR